MKVDVESKAMRRLDRAYTYYGLMCAVLLLAGLVAAAFAPPASPVLIGGGLVCGLLAGLYRLASDVVDVRDEDGW